MKLSQTRAVNTPSLLSYYRFGIHIQNIAHRLDHAYSWKIHVIMSMAIAMDDIAPILSNDVIEGAYDTIESNR